jgi:hypothetical protein
LFAVADERPGGLFTADDLHHDIDGGVVDHVIDAGGQEAGGEVDRAGLFQVAHGSAPDRDGGANLAGEVLAPLDEGAGHSAAYDAQADQPYANLALHWLSQRSSPPIRATSWRGSGLS